MLDFVGLLVILEGGSSFLMESGLSPHGRKCKCVVHLLRHGETAWNSKKKLQGQTDIPLNENGLTQAQAIARLLVQHSIACKYAAVFSSDLARASNTAKVVVDIANTKHKVHADARLRERAMGSHVEGKTWASLTHEQKHALRTGTPEGGESSQQMLERMVQAVAEIAHKHAAVTDNDDISPPHILVVSHGGAMGTLLEYANMNSSSSSSSSSKTVPHIRNCGVYSLTVAFDGDSVDTVEWTYDGIVVELDNTSTKGGERVGG